MGLIRAAVGATLGTLADQWKEYFTCNALEKDVLVVKGQKMLSGRSSNRYGSDNVISDGSGIVVADGQCAIIVDQGVVTELVAEPGLFTYSSSGEPSLFVGKLDEQKIKSVFLNMWERFKYGGAAGRDQRVYYFNVKEIIDNKFGTAVPIPFRVVDRNIGLDLDVSLRCNGVYSFRIIDPISFYTNVCGNIANQYDVDEIQGQLKSEFISALQPALAHLSDLEIRPYSLPSHVQELCDLMNTELSQKWSSLRGLSVVSIAINSVTLPDEDAQMVKQLQRGAVMRDPSMAAAQLAAAQAEAMKTAAGNSGGAMNGFMGVGMAQQAGGINVADLFKMAGERRAAPAAPAPQPKAAGSWKCECGAENTGKFCQECGKPKPEEHKGWTCSCGAVNLGKFCSECGSRRPVGAPIYQCDKCGWQPEDPHHPPKFCPECGDPFDDNDIKNK
ncbi:MAG: SPFH domain-containing protein [Succinivibrio sp.]|nr:SPFH domain-containing protein [Succinivibrio sp.]